MRHITFKPVEAVMFWQKRMLHVIWKSGCAWSLNWTCLRRSCVALFLFLKDRKAISFRFSERCRDGTQRQQQFSQLKKDLVFRRNFSIGDYLYNLKLRTSHLPCQTRWLYSSPLFCSLSVVLTILIRKDVFTRPHQWPICASRSMRKNASFGSWWFLEETALIKIRSFALFRLVTIL